MNNILTNTYGVDSVIQSLQNQLYNKLKTIWSGDIDGYGRVFKNIDNDSNSYIPQWWDSDKLEYTDVMHNDNVSATFCFINSDSNKTDDGEVYVTDIKCVFMVNLNSLYPNDIERSDERVKSDVLNILQNNFIGLCSIKGTDKGVANVFNGFETSKILNTDIQPKHCFSVNINTNYYLNCI